MPCAALAAARDLAGDELEEPAALLFVFATYRRAFPAWNFMARAIAMQHAHALGYAIETTRTDLDALLSAVMYGTAEYEHVRAWVGSRLRPLHQS